MNKLIVLISILIIWGLSGAYSFELIKEGTVVNSIQIWEFYKNPAEDFKFIIIHLFLSLIIGAIIGLALSFLLKANKQTE